MSDVRDIFEEKMRERWPHTAHKGYQGFNILALSGIYADGNLQSAWDGFQAALSVINDKWQTMESAPKHTVLIDGMHRYGPSILLSVGPNVYRGRWWEAHSITGKIQSNFLRDGSIACFPTAWMPLPESHKEKTE